MHRQMIKAGKIIKLMLPYALGLLVWASILEEKTIVAQTPHHNAGSMPAPVRYTRTTAAYEAPDVTLVGMDDDQVKLRAILNHEGPVMLQFIFTSCTTVCPLMTATLSGTQNKLGDDLKSTRMISVSIDPEHDTPERLRNYAKTFKAGSRWSFLTGSIDDITAVQKAFDVYRGDKMRHEPVTFLRATNGASWVRLEGFMSTAQLVEEYKRLTEAR